MPKSVKKKGFFPNYMGVMASFGHGVAMPMSRNQYERKFC